MGDNDADKWEERFFKQLEDTLTDFREKLEKQINKCPTCYENFNILIDKRVKSAYKVLIVIGTIFTIINYMAKFLK